MQIFIPSIATERSILVLECLISTQQPFTILLSPFCASEIICNCNNPVIMLPLSHSQSRARQKQTSDMSVTEVSLRRQTYNSRRLLINNLYTNTNLL